MRAATWLTAGLASFLAAGVATAAGGTATDQAVSLTYGVTHWSGSPAADLRGADASGDQLSESGWWWRLADGSATRERPLPPPSTETFADGAIRATWTSQAGLPFDLEETTWVVDAERPSGGFLTRLTIRATTAPVTVTLFHYLDPSLRGLFTNDSAELVGEGFIRFSDGPTRASYRASFPARFQAAGQPGLRDALNDGGLTDLTNAGLPFGPGDASAAFQFRTLQVFPGFPESVFVSFVVNPAHDHVTGDFLGVLPFPPLCGQAADLSTPGCTLMRRTGALDASIGFTGPHGVGFDRLEGLNDFDGDLDDELVFRFPRTGDVFVGGRQIAGAPTLPLTWKLSTTGDFDHDGKADILWRNTVSQKLVVWTMNGSTKTGNLVPNPPQAVDANWEVAGSADFDGDGNRDLLWYNQTTGKIVVWYLTASLVRITGQFTTPSSVGSNAWRVVAVGDYGKGPGGQFDTPDIVWQNDVSKKTVVWHMDPTGTRTSGGFTTPDAALGSLEVVGPR